MGILQNASDYYRNLDLEKVALKSIRDNESFAIDLNTSQLFSGQDAAGNFLQAYRSVKYAALKKSMNPKGVTDLKLSGDFYDGFFLKADNFPVIFGSKDQKSEFLAQKYGSEIFGLNKKSLADLATVVKADLGKALHFRNHTI